MSVHLALPLSLRPRVRALILAFSFGLLCVLGMADVCGQPGAAEIKPTTALPAAQYAMEDTPWVMEGKFSSPAVTEKDIQTFAGTRQSSSKFKGWDLSMIGGKIRFMSTPLRGTSHAFTTEKRYDDGQDHALRLTWEPASRQATLYVDGERVGGAAAVTSVGSAPGMIFVFGAKQNTSKDGWMYAWKGSLRDWRFYAGAPTDQPPQASVAPATNASAPAASAPTPAAVARPTSALKAISLPGSQIALTWKEGTGAQRTLLAYGKPITEENRLSARAVAQKILPKSANDWYEDPSETNRPALPKQGWVLGPGRKPLDSDGGLFVYTASPDDAGDVYFAVLADGEAVVPGENATTAPMPVAQGGVEAIPQSADVVAAMKAARPGLPVALYLHPHTSRPKGALTHLFFGDKSMGWREGLPFKFKVTVTPDYILVEPYDRVWINRKLERGEVSESYDQRYHNIESWWYGTNEFINDADMRIEGKAVNYTQRWVMWMLDWVVKNYRADSNRVYGFGVSMGTGVQLLAFNNPDRFAAVDVLVPFFDWTYVGAEGSNVRRVTPRLGTMEQMTPQGTTLADEMNLVAKVNATTADLPFVVARCGRNDKSVFWERKPAYFEAMNRQGNGLLALWDQGDHATAGRRPAPGFPNFQDVGWYAERFALNRSFPAIVNYSGNDDYGNGKADSGAPSGFINRGLDWKVKQDEAGGYRIEFLRTQGAPAGTLSFDFVVRRPQGFRPASGARVDVECAGPGMQTQKRTVTVPADGRVKVTGVTMPENSVSVSLKAAASAP